MKEEREFLKQLNRNRFDKIPFLEYFQKDKYLRKLLFDIHKQNKQPFFDIKLFKSLNEIDKEIKDFKNLVLNEIKFNSLIYSESFVKNIIYKSEIIQIPKLTKSILNNFVDEVENVELLAAYITEDNDHSFENQYDISFKEAERKYRELKRFADNYFIDYLKENINTEQPISKKPQPKTYLKNLFNKNDSYDNVIEVLVENDFLSKSKDSLEWIYPEKDGLTTIQTIIALFVTLELKNYFNHNKVVKYRVIKNEFGITMDKGTYSRSSSSFKKDFTTTVKNKNYTYLSLFRDIF